MDEVGIHADMHRVKGVCRTWAPSAFRQVVKTAVEALAENSNFVAPLVCTIGEFGYVTGFRGICASSAWFTWCRLDKIKSDAKAGTRL